MTPSPDAWLAGEERASLRRPPLDEECRADRLRTKERLEREERR